jgi:hypothetical protein
MEGMSRPVWGCLDAQEIRESASGRSEDPAIREHLARCGQCRQVVQELRGDLRRPRRSGGVSHGRSLLSRPGFWFVLVLGGLVFGLWQLFPRKAPQPGRATTAELPPAAPSQPRPVATPAPRPIAHRPRPRPRGGSPDDAAIVAVIRNNQTGVRMCYERALRSNPRLSLRLDVRVNVSPDGVPERVSLDGLPGNAILADCIRNVIKTWPFPRQTAAYETEFPLRLQQSL